MTEAPQLLPFTYPPFAAILAIPLALLPFGVIGWLWTGAAGRRDDGHRLVRRVAPDPPHRRPGRRSPWPLLTAPDAVAAPGVRRHPLRSGQRLHGAGVPDGPAATAPRRAAPAYPTGRPRRARDVDQAHPGRLRRALPGQPAVEGGGDRGRHRRRGHASARGCCCREASFAFWGGALQDPARLGPNAGTSNQCIRGFLLRVGPDGARRAPRCGWSCVAVVGVVGFCAGPPGLPAGDSISEVAAVGLMAVLLSPVAWIHHLHWMVVVDLRRCSAPTRCATGAGCGPRLAVTGVLPLPAAVVGDLLAQPRATGRSWLGRILQNADTFGVAARPRPALVGAAPSGRGARRSARPTPGRSRPIGAARPGSRPAARGPGQRLGAQTSGSGLRPAGRRSTSPRCGRTARPAAPPTQVSTNRPTMTKPT